RRAGVAFDVRARLTHCTPAGPKIKAPPGVTVLVAPLLIEWDPVTAAILTHKPNLGPVDIVGYHILVEEDVPGVEVTPEVDIDVDASQTSLTVPDQYLNPSTVYRFEILSTDQSGNQTISEGFFC